MVSTRKKLLLGFFILCVVTTGILLPLFLWLPTDSLNIQLEVLSEFETGGFTYDVFVKDDIAYLSIAKEPGPSELMILDVSDPSNPMELGSYGEIGYPDQLVVVDEIVFITDRFGPLCIINVTDPSNPEKIGEYNGSGETYDIEVVGDIAYLADWNQGLKILNISEPSTPELIGYYNVLGAANQLDIVGDLLYLSDHRSSRTGLVVLNVSDPTDPFLVGSYLPSDELWNAHVFGDYIYCGNHELEGGALIILDANDPAIISEVGQFNFSDVVNSVIVHDDIAFAAGGMRGLYLIDVADPSNPNLITALDGLMIGRDLALIGDIVYLACDGWFCIVQMTES
ncbi:MAG: LVIVD repeat-containing protein [Candidatus Sifarchaeia archaeon]